MLLAIEIFMYICFAWLVFLLIKTIISTIKEARKRNVNLDQLITDNACCWLDNATERVESYRNMKKEANIMFKTREEEINYWKQKDDRERRARLPYWKQIIEDLTGFEIMDLTYNSDREYLEVFWADQHREKLFINIHMDSLRACTYDVIMQTNNWINRMRG